MSRIVGRRSLRVKFAAVLCLVLGITGVLLASTLAGLYSYRRTIKTLGACLEELPHLAALLESLVHLAYPDGAAERPVNPPGAASLAARLSASERALEAYGHRLKTLAAARGESAGRRDEERWLREIEGALRELRELSQRSVDDGRVRLLPPEAVGPWGFPSGGHLAEPLARAIRPIGPLLRGAFSEVDHLVDESRQQYRNTLGLAWITGGLVLVSLLLFGRLFYRWLFWPIRVLHQGVLRVGRGDLSYRLDLPTGDEMEELAGSFNQMTQRLQAIYQDLERQVEERSRQLVRTERLASVGFLAAGVAHEINNPLASISLGAEALARRLKQVLPQADDPARYQDIWRCLDMIQSEAFRCKGITEKLLDFSRVGELKRVPTSLPSLVSDVIDVVRHLGRYREKHIVAEAATDVVAEVNPEEMKQVVLNLIVNALDSMDPGGKLEIRMYEEGPWAVLVFEDDGCGMTPDVLENIFEPFFTRRRSSRGTGLGLSITHRIVTQHQGEITAYSEGPGRGSRFTVRVPLKAAPPERGKEAPCGNRAA
jgi:two-component system NtrC family sensor kinase